MVAKRKTTEEDKLVVYRRLSAHHADAHCELVFRNPFELLCATVLSAQTTDVAVNKASPTLFARFPSPKEMAAAGEGAIEECINSIGMYRQKAKHLRGLSRLLLEHHGGRVPETLPELVALPGVGRKTANVVLGVAFGKSEGVVVDTHVQRISQRLGWTKKTEPVPIEQDLMKLLPRSEWDHVSHVLIFHGRRICAAQRPACEICPVNDACPSAGNADGVGRKKPPARRKKASQADRKRTRPRPSPASKGSQPSKTTGKSGR